MHHIKEDVNSVQKDILNASMNADYNKKQQLLAGSKNNSCTCIMDHHVDEKDYQDVTICSNDLNPFTKTFKLWSHSTHVLPNKDKQLVSLKTH